MIFFGVIAGIIILFAVSARRTQKQKKFKEGAQPTTAQPATATTTAKPSGYGKPSQMTLSSKSGSKCLRCGAAMKPGDLFCSECGGKVSGRRTSATTKKTPINSKICSFCGIKLEPIDNYCKYCGTGVGK